VFLTTRDGPSGQLHARQMVPQVQKDLTHLFLYDKESHKHQEVKDDENVNVAYDGGNQGWASVAGTASPSQDKDLIKKVSCLLCF
jgi:general stress protein 26